MNSNWLDLLNTYGPVAAAALAVGTGAFLAFRAGSKKYLLKPGQLFGGEPADLDDAQEVLEEAQEKLEETDTGLADAKKALSESKVKANQLKKAWKAKVDASAPAAEITAAEAAYNNEAAALPGLKTASCTAKTSRKTAKNELATAKQQLRRAGNPFQWFALLLCLAATGLVLWGSWTWYNLARAPHVIGPSDAKAAMIELFDEATKVKGLGFSTHTDGKVLEIAHPDEGIEPDMTEKIKKSLDTQIAEWNKVHPGGLHKVKLIKAHTLVMKPDECTVVGVLTDYTADEFVAGKHTDVQRHCVTVMDVTDAEKIIDFAKKQKSHYVTFAAAHMKAGGLEEFWPSMGRIQRGK